MVCRCWTLIYHDLRHHMVKMLWTDEPQPKYLEVKESHSTTVLCAPDRHGVARLHAAGSPANIAVVRTGTKASNVTARVSVGTKSLAKTASKRRLYSDRMSVVLLKATALQFAKQTKR